ncbi:MAG: hemerythrin domain-containing protein [Deltaproteobacteria bacterium]|nr:hemerythrin domain-containing protein [Deltaproteobacteria bacterium]
MTEYRFTGVLERAADDHERLLGLFIRLLDVDDAIVRRQLVASVAREIERHAAAEHATLYAALRELPGAGDLLDDAAAEHDEIAEALDDLIATPTDDPTWTEMLAALRACVERHIETEEGEVFTIAEELLGGDKLIELGDAFARHGQARAGSAAFTGQSYMLPLLPRIGVTFLRL